MSMHSYTEEQRFDAALSRLAAARGWSDSQRSEIERAARMLAESSPVLNLTGALDTLMRQFGARVPTQQVLVQNRAQRRAAARRAGRA